MTLTEHQQQKVEEVMSYFKNGAKRVKLVGNAGVGKTVVGAKIAELFRKDHGLNGKYNNGKVYVTTPTNKALAVIKNKVKTPVEFATIHSALKIRPYTDSKTGFEAFVRTAGRNDEFSNCKAAIIDEASMLGVFLEGGYVTEMVNNVPTEVYKKGHLDGIGFPILYMGDDKQLSPVGEKDSAVWLKDYPTVTLTEIVRQGKGNPIIELSMDTDLVFMKIPNLIDGKGYTYNNDKGLFIDMLAEVNGTDELKYLAYTNSTVDDVNKSVRERIYGDNPRKIEKGEMLVINTPIAGYYTNQEIKVEELDIITANIPIPNEKTKFDSSNKPTNGTDFIKLKYYRINDSLNIIHEHSEALFNHVFKTLVFNCDKRQWDYKGKTFLKNSFASIKYNHAITIHKSQGSTYKSSIIDIGNIMFNKDSNERQRLLYTAITRSSDLIILNNVK